MPPGDPAQAQSLYRAGMELYGRQQYEEALGSFDRAMSLGDNSWKVLDAKAATMNKLGGAWRQSAFEIASGLCKKYGEKNHRPWYRVASILIAMDMIAAAERSIAKGLGLAKDLAARNALLELRSQSEQAKTRLAARKAQTAAEAEAERAAAEKAKMCFAHLLPPDVLLHIATIGVAADPDFALRLAGVCREWRAVALDRPPLWASLRVGRRRPAAKVAAWAERSGGRLRSVFITDRVPTDRHAEVATALFRCLPDVEDLTLHGRIEAYVARWPGRCRRLRTLVLDNDSSPLLPFLFGILHPEATHLHTVDIAQAVLPMSTAQAAPAAELSAENLWLPNASRQLQNLRKLRIGGGQVFNREMWLPSLIKHAPQLREIDIGCQWPGVRAPPPDEDAPADPVELPCLTRLEMKDTAGMSLPFETLSTPNLTCFSCYGWNPRHADTLSNLRAPGLAAALPILVSLDIGRCGVSQEELLALVPELVSLRFLNVSFCGIDNNFLEQLIIDEGRTPLLPSLTALSLAGHDTISAGPLRQVVLSRNVAARTTAVPAAVAPLARSAFAPARSAFGPARRRPQPPPQPAAQTPTPAASPSYDTRSLSGGRVAPLSWVCVDRCNHPDMDVRVLDTLRRHLRFLSNHGGNLVEDRVRGRGAYSWETDGDWDDSCASGSTGCHLRKRRADQDTWYVHHSCKRAKVDTSANCKQG